MLDDGEPARDAFLPAVMNVGHRPTFSGEEMRAEAHLLDFDGDLYGRRVELSFSVRLRAEQKFESVEALKRQIGADVENARRRLEAL
jgi:riboflavin kinase/FMN adenylyltransferase